jgi:hypothetical protein
MPVFPQRNERRVSRPSTGAPCRRRRSRRSSRTASG